MTTEAQSRSLFDFQPDELGDWLVERGQPKYRAKQLLKWAYRGIDSYDEMTDLPAALRQELADALPLQSLTAMSHDKSRDNRTDKVLFRLSDGSLIESVHMGHPTTGNGWRTTICISSQAGCAYGCKFCATGQQGYGRNLTSGEIVEQVVDFVGGSSLSPSKGTAESEQASSTMPSTSSGNVAAANRITNIVFMGMGEPFSNYDEVMKAARTLNAPWGLGLGARHMTISTVGLVPEIRRFTKELLQANLAISLHAPNDEIRNSLMPVNRKYPIKELMKAVRDYIAWTNRRVTFEYVILDGVNDDKSHAIELAALLEGMLCHVNVIPVNPTGASEFKRPPIDRIHNFVNELHHRNIPVTLRDTQGTEIQAGCGQLSTKAEAINESLVAAQGSVSEEQ